MLTLYLDKRKVLLRLDLSVACFLCVCTDFLVFVFQYRQLCLAFVHPFTSAQPG